VTGAAHAGQGRGFLGLLRDDRALRLRVLGLYQRFFGRDLDAGSWGNRPTPVEPDGLEFDDHGVSISEIREAQDHPGKRIKLPTRLGNARLNLQVDVASETP